MKCIKPLTPMSSQTLSHTRSFMIDSHLYPAACILLHTNMNRVGILSHYVQYVGCTKHSIIKCSDNAHPRNPNPWSLSHNIWEYRSPRHYLQCPSVHWCRDEEIWPRHLQLSCWRSDQANSSLLKRGVFRGIIWQTARPSRGSTKPYMHAYSSRNQ